MRRLDLPVADPRLEAATRLLATLEEARSALLEVAAEHLDPPRARRLARVAERYEVRTPLAVELRLRREAAERPPAPLPPVPPPAPPPTPRGGPWIPLEHAVRPAAPPVTAAPSPPVPPVAAGSSVPTVPSASVASLRAPPVRLRSDDTRPPASAPAAVMSAPVAPPAVAETAPAAQGITGDSTRILAAWGLTPDDAAATAPPGRADAAPSSTADAPVAAPPASDPLIPEVRFPTLDTPMTIRTSPRGGMVAEMRWADLSPSRGTEDVPVAAPVVPPVEPVAAPVVPVVPVAAPVVPDDAPPVRRGPVPEIRLPAGPARAVATVGIAAGPLRLAPAAPPVAVAPVAPMSASEAVVPVAAPEVVMPVVPVAAPEVVVPVVPVAAPEVVVPVVPVAAPEVVVPVVVPQTVTPVVVSVEEDRVAGSLEDAWFEEPSPPTDAEDHRSAARSAAERGLFGDAVSLWSAFLARVPDDLDARLGRGIALQELGDFAAAAEDLAYAVALAPGAFAPAIALADLSFFRKDYDESIIRYDAALRIDPGHAMALCRRGLARFHLRDWRAAAADLEAARATDPSIPQIDTYIRLARQGIRER